jgi:Thioesterase-like superfamily
MTETIFVEQDGLFTPTEQARGPWDPQSLHGGAPAALITSVFEQMQPGAELTIARLSFEFLRPVPMAPLSLTTRITRPGRRVQALEADLHAAGEHVCRARALRVLSVPQELPTLALEQVKDHDVPLPGPQDGRDVRFALDDTERASFAATAMEMRFLKGGPAITAKGPADSQLGPAVVWMRLRHPLSAEQPATPTARLVAASDFGNGVSAVLPFEQYLFINADLSISLNRRAEGEWIALEASTLLHPGGVGWAQSTLYDQRGQVGLATQALVVQRR